MEIRLARLEDGSACNEFHNKFYGERRTLEQWKWTFTQQIFDKFAIPLVMMEEGGKITGTQAIIPIRMIDENGIFWTAKSEETLLDPSTRGKGLLREMFKVIFEYTEKHKIVAIWGFTEAAKAFKKIGFEIPGSATHLFRPFSVKWISSFLKQDNSKANKDISAIYRLAGPITRVASALIYSVNRLRSRPTWLKDIQIKTLREPPEQAGELCARFIKQWGGVTIFRDRDYLRWRIFQNPFIQGVFRAAYERDKLLGWVVYSVDQKSVGQIIDLMAATEENKLRTIAVAELLLQDAVKRLWNVGALAARSWHVTNHPFDLALTHLAYRKGFLNTRRGNPEVLYRSKGIKGKHDTNLFNNGYITRIYTQGVEG